MDLAVGDRAGWGLIAVGIGSLALWQAACDPSTDTDPDGDTGASGLEADVLAAVGPEVVVPALDAVDAALPALEDALGAWASGTGTREDALPALLAVFEAWQAADVLRIDTDAAVALDLRDEVYSWPLVNGCSVDQATAAGNDVAGVLVNAKGLDALLHVLTVDPVDNVCPRQIPPNSDGAWDALSEAEIEAARATYAQDLADTIADDVDAKRTAWADAEPVDLQAVLDGVYALESVVKDSKLGFPLGIVDCSADCLSGAEGDATVPSLRWIEANLRAVRTLFAGGEGVGLDDVLDDAGHGEVAASFLAGIDDALALSASLDDNLIVAIESDRDAVVAFYDAVDAADEVLRNEVTPGLLLEIPAEVGGDTD